MEKLSPGSRFRLALADQKPLQIVGVINAYVALMAKKVGFQTLYLSGAGVANSSYGLPDIGLTTLDNVLVDVRRITEAVDLPLLVDIDTGWGSHEMVERSIKAMIHAGAAGVHIEDQIFNKRCGHLPGKTLVSTEEMCERLKAADRSRQKWDPHFYLIARTDAFENEGLEGTILRAKAYQEAGADALFAEAFKTLNDYRIVKDAIEMPLLANLTEFGKTPLYTVDELRGVGVDMILYPLSASRGMNRTALEILEEIHAKGTQKKMLDRMQTRDELYNFLNYPKIS